VNLEIHLVKPTSSFIEKSDASSDVMVTLVSPLGVPSSRSTHLETRWPRR